MSIRPQPFAPVPDQTARVARAAFPKGNPYLTLRETLGTIFQDDSFADLYAHDGQPGVAPAWLQDVAPLAWYERYGRRIEDSRLPREPTKRDAYAQTVGEDGFMLLDALESPEAPETLCTLPCVATLRQLWQDHYERQA